MELGLLVGFCGNSTDLGITERIIGAQKFFSAMFPLYPFSPTSPFLLFILLVARLAWNLTASISGRR